MNRERFSQLLADRLIIAKITGTILWLSWIASLIIGGFKFDARGQLSGSDHIAFYSAARLIADGRGPKAYDYFFLTDYQTEMVGRPYLDAYRNPPFYALLYLPTSQLPYIVSFWIWTLVSFAALWFGLRWLGTTKQSSVFVWALTFYPVFAAISFGQNSLLSFAVFALTFHLLERDRRFAAGFAAGLLLYKPQLLLCLGLWWLLDVRRYWRALAGLTAMGLVLLGISMLAVPEETREFVRRLRDIASYDAFFFYNLHTPVGFFTLLFEDDKQIGRVLGGICSLVAIAGLVVFWRRYRGDMPLMFAAVVFVTLWASPHTMVYEWSLAVIPAVLLWELRPQLRARLLPLFAVGWVALLISTPVAQWIFDNLPLGHRIELEYVADPPGITWTTRPVYWSIQLSVPVLAVLGILAERELRRERVTLPREGPSAPAPAGI